MIVLPHGKRNCCVLQDTCAGRGKALAPGVNIAKDHNPTGDYSLGFRRFREARHSWDLSVVPAPHTRSGQRGRIGLGPAQPWRRVLLRRLALRRGAALGGAGGAGSFGKLHPSSALVKKRPIFRRGHNYRTGCAARWCAAAEQRRWGSCAHGVISRWRRAAAAHTPQYGCALPQDQSVMVAAPGGRDVLF
jgi:hypothetical protein